MTDKEWAIAEDLEKHNFILMHIHDRLSEISKMFEMYLVHELKINADEMLEVHMGMQKFYGEYVENMFVDQAHMGYSPDKGLYKKEFYVDDKNEFDEREYPIGYDNSRKRNIDKDGYFIEDK